MNKGSQLSLARVYHIKTREIKYFFNKIYIYQNQGWHDRGILVLNGICIRYLIPQGIDSSSIPQVLNTSRKKYRQVLNT